jgi:hypothetical protein
MEGGMAKNDGSFLNTRISSDQRGPNVNRAHDVAAKKPRNWIAGATENKGGLHRSLGIAEGVKIPLKKIEVAAEKGGKVGRQARLAETLRGFRR